MDGLGGHYTKGSKSQRKRQTLCDITYMWNLKNTTNCDYNKKEADSQMQRTNEQFPVRRAKEERAIYGQGKNGLLWDFMKSCV